MFVTIEKGIRENARNVNDAFSWNNGYNYKGKLRSAELLLRENGNVELIRREETPDDYFTTLDVTGYFKSKRNFITKKG